MAGTNLQINDEMVDENNIKITQVDDPRETEYYPKFDLKIDQQPSQPTTEPRNEVPTYEPTNMGTTETVIETPTTTPIIKATKVSLENQ